jgi:hypothetical protein
VSAAPGSYAAVMVHQKLRGEWYKTARLFKLC